VSTVVSSSSSSGCIGFARALTILFIALKLTGVIAWSWMWVLSPLWITGLIVLAALALLLIAAIALNWR
jgi:hypothetical protein